MKTIERPKNVNDRHRLGARLLREHNQEKEDGLRKERMRIKKEKTEFNKPENRKARREELRKAKRKAAAAAQRLSLLAV